MKTQGVQNSTQKEYWHEENLPNDAIVLFRNLVGGKPINVKMLYDDTVREKTEEKRQSRKHHSNQKKKGKKPVVSKKDLIIQKNILDKQERNLKEDRIRIHSFSETDHLDFERWLSYQLTDIGRNEMKIVALRKAVSARNKVILLELALQIENDMIPNPDDKKFLAKIKKQIDRLPTKELQLELLGNRLPPLDFYNNTKFRLDDWQLQVLDYIKTDISVLVTAPTSSGKTILSTYFATIGNTVLYVVPSKPLAFQVASIFHTIAGGEGIALFVDDFSYYPSKDIRVVVGTPYELENKFPVLPELDIAVFDEVHNINSECGACYERIIKWHNGNFLALSATIKNSEVVLGWLNSLINDREVKLVDYKKRFINIQRHVWNDSSHKLEKLHPLTCLQLDDFQDKTPQLPFTPWDCITTWKSLTKIMDEEDLPDKLDPEVFFKEVKRITLDNSKNYETALKTYLSTELDKERLTQLLDQHKKIDSVPTSKFNIVKLLMDLKNKDMFPCITFNTNTVMCQELFTKIVKGLEEEEGIYFPCHYDNLEHRHELYNNYIEKRQKFSAELKESEKEARLMKFDKAELQQYQKDITERYDKNIETLTKFSTNPSVLKVQLRHLKQEYNNILESDDIGETDLFEKCPEYCFTHDPMKSDRIRKIKRMISRKMNMKVDYTNIMLQGLKRGIGIYTKDLPDVYLRIVQELAQNKELGVVISDESLALGINMPFRTSIMCGWKDHHTIPPLLFQQMSGRAGRRGLDSEGHVIFANVYWKDIMKGEMEEMIGVAQIPYGYSILSEMDADFTDRVTRINSHYLNNYVTNNEVTTNLNDFTGSNYNEITKKAIWKLRKYHQGAIQMGEKLDDLELYLKKETVTKTDVIRLLKFIIIQVFSDKPDIHNIQQIVSVNFQDNKLLDIQLQQLLVIFERNRLDDYIDDQQKHIYINLLIEVANIVKILHNLVTDFEYFTATRNLLKMCFHHCKLIIYNYHKLNNY